jgi:DNA primase
MERRILCPNHEESTPSFVVYPDGMGHCFGCGYRAKVTEGVKIDKDKFDAEAQAKFVEQLSYIESLPKVPIRGLTLHADSERYYIVWPTRDYYKSSCFRRTDDSPKYVGARGIKKPMFKAVTGRSRTLAVVEGEINALSIQSIADCDVVSPGGAGDFYSSRFEKDLTLYKNYDKVMLVADADAAGTKAVIELKSRLLAAGMVDVAIKLVEEDFNDVLTKYGQEELKNRIRHLGL